MLAEINGSDVKKSGGSLENLLNKELSRKRINIVILCIIVLQFRAVYRIFAKGGRTWSMSKRGGARLFVAARQPQGGGCRRGMCPLPQTLTLYYRK